MIRPTRLKLLASFICFAMLFSSAAVAQRLEYSQLDPQARRIIVDEIRIQLEKENERRHVAFLENLGSWATIGSGIIGVLVALLGIAGWRGLANLRGNIRNDLIAYVSSDKDFDRAIENRLRSVVETVASSENERMRRQLSLARLELLSRKVSESNRGFTDAERYAMQDLLIEASADPEVRDSHAFSSTAHRVVDSLRGAALDHDTDRLEDALGQHFSGIPLIVASYVVSYGDRILEKDEIDDELMAKFKKYAEFNKSHKNLDWLAYELLFAHKFGGSQKEKFIQSLLKQVAYLKKDDKSWLYGRLERIAQIEDEKIDSFRLFKEVEATRNFLVEYGEQLKQLIGVEEKQDA